MNARTMIGTGACALVLGGLGLGFAQIGSPQTNRLRSADARVQQAIYEIASDTTVGASKNLRRSAPVYPAALDPDIRRAITFENRSQNEYALCANFNLVGNEFSEYGEESPTWAHPGGRHCYRFRWNQIPSDTYAPVPLPG